MTLTRWTFVGKVMSLLFNMLSRLELYHLHIWGCWYFSQQSWFQLVIHPARHFTWWTLPISSINRVTICSLFHIPFPILNRSKLLFHVHCPHLVLIVASWRLCSYTALFGASSFLIQISAWARLLSVPASRRAPLVLSSQPPHYHESVTPWSKVIL